MKITFRPSGVMPGFNIEAEDQSDSGILELIGRLWEGGYDLGVGGATLASGARLRYPNITLSMHKRVSEKQENASMIKITAWIVVAHNGQLFGPFATPEEAAAEINRCSDMFTGPLLVQPVLELPKLHEPDEKQP